MFSIPPASRARGCFLLTSVNKGAEVAAEHFFLPILCSKKKLKTQHNAVVWALSQITVMSPCHVHAFACMAGHCDATSFRQRVRMPCRTMSPVSSPIACWRSCSGAPDISLRCSLWRVLPEVCIICANYGFRCSFVWQRCLRADVPLS